MNTRLIRSVSIRPFVTPRRSLRHNSTQQTPEPVPQAASNPHRDFYRGFGRTVAFNFLIAMTTFQAIYWSWLKLESMETKKEKEDELQSLEGELKSLTGTQTK